jgi:hypothetical protein
MAITLKRGERLVIHAPVTDLATGDPVDLEAGGYEVASWVADSVFRVDLGATLDGDTIKIDFDTHEMPIGNYTFDIRLTKDERDAFTSPDVALQITQGPTPRSIRS